MRTLLIGLLLAGNASTALAADYQMTCSITRGSNTETTTYVVRDYQKLFVVNKKTGQLEEFSVEENYLVVNSTGFAYTIIIADYESYSTTDVKFVSRTATNTRGYIGQGSASNYTSKLYPGPVNNVYEGTCSQLSRRK